jgi:hypothetical protein
MTVIAAPDERDHLSLPPASFDWMQALRCDEGTGLLKPFLSFLRKV